MSAFVAVCFHEPAVAGSSVGRARPSTACTGSENVIVIDEVGLIVVPGAGFTTACRRRPAGNQLTRTGAASASHDRAATDTSAMPKRSLPLARSPVSTLA